MAVNYNTSWADALGAYNPNATPMLGATTSVAPAINVTAPRQTTTLASALTGGAAGQGDISGALDRYTQSLGQMKTTDWINAGLGGIQTIGGLIGAFGSLGLANKQYDLQKRMAETNLTNSVQAYNTALEDKARSRAVVEGTSAADTAAYIASHKATTGN